MSENWKAVVDHEGLYEISDTGRVRSLERRGVYAGRWGDAQMLFPAREMAISTSTRGYKYLCLKKPNEAGVKHLLHRLVMRTFMGEPTAERPQVNHKDGDKANNVLANLEYVSSQENQLHCTRVLKKKRGEAGGQAKLTEVQARSVLTDGRTLKAIANDYGVSLQAIWLIKKGVNWAHLQEERTEA